MVDPEKPLGTNDIPRSVGENPLITRAFVNAPKRTRTSTGESPHKALNLARLPIPPPAQGLAQYRRLIPSAG
ncbi:MAG: hypothetical protein QOJ89_5009, partial [bacterium]